MLKLHHFELEQLSFGILPVTHVAGPLFCHHREIEVHQKVQEEENEFD